MHTTAPLSISLAFTFRTEVSDRTTAIHQFNQRLRRIGLRPSPVGIRGATDAVKAGTVALARSGWRMIRSARPDRAEEPRRRC